MAQKELTTEQALARVITAAAIIRVQAEVLVAEYAASQGMDKEEVNRLLKEAEMSVRSASTEATDLENPS